MPSGRALEAPRGTLEALGGALRAGQPGKIRQVRRAKADPPKKITAIRCILAMHLPLGLDLLYLSIIHRSIYLPLIHYAIQLIEVIVLGGN